MTKEKEQYTAELRFEGVDDADALFIFGAIKEAVLHYAYLSGSDVKVTFRLRAADGGEVQWR
jgi:hypothetical protein